jgi:hypothetical protein
VGGAWSLTGPRLDQAVGSWPPALRKAWGLKDLSSPPQDIKSGRSPLIHAVENNSLSMVQLLLQVGPSLPCPSSDHNPAVTAAPGTDPRFPLRALARSQLSDFTPLAVSLSHSSLVPSAAVPSLR